MTEEKILEALDKLVIVNNPQVAQQLRELINCTYDLVSSEGKITDWQKIRIAEAISAYKIYWLHSCKFSLLLALEDPLHISQEPQYLKHCKDFADSIDIEKFLFELNSNIDQKKSGKFLSD
jgi:hypothetical protein